MTMTRRTLLRTNAAAFLLLNACAPLAPVTTTGTPTTPVVSSNPTIESVIAEIDQTGPGSNILAWVSGLGAPAQAALAKFNAGIGLTTAEVKNLCAMDNSIHPLIGLVASLVPTFGNDVAAADNVAYAGIQSGCAVATTGTLPSLAQLNTIVGEFSAATAALGIKL